MKGIVFIPSCKTNPAVSFSYQAQRSTTDTLVQEDFIKSKPVGQATWLYLPDPRARPSLSRRREVQPRAAQWSAALIGRAWRWHTAMGNY